MSVETKKKKDKKASFLTSPYRAPPRNITGNTALIVTIHVLVHRRKMACLTIYMVQYLAAAARNVGQAGTRSRDIHVAT
jgi:hypothetical protein